MTYILLLSTVVAFANERTENNGNLILKNIPLIPEAFNKILHSTKMFDLLLLEDLVEKAMKYSSQLALEM